MEDIVIEEDIMWMMYVLMFVDKVELIGEVLVGVCVVLNGELIGEGFNMLIMDNDLFVYVELCVVKEVVVVV